MCGDSGRECFYGNPIQLYQIVFNNHEPMVGKNYFPVREMSCDILILFSFNQAQISYGPILDGSHDPQKNERVLTYTKSLLKRRFNLETNDTKLTDLFACNDPSC